MFLIAVQPPFSTIRCKSLAASLIPLLPCPMFTRIPAGFLRRPTAPVPAAPPFPMSPLSQIPNRAQTRHTRHARVAATPIPSAICAQFPSHMGVGVSRLSPSAAQHRPAADQTPATQIPSMRYSQSPSPIGEGLCYTLHRAHPHSTARYCLRDLFLSPASPSWRANRARHQLTLALNQTQTIRPPCSSMLPGRVCP